MNPWTAFIERAGNTIVLRGETYYENGHVHDLEEPETGFWSATVLGSEMYEVTIEIVGEEVTSWTCNCPYDGGICKHTVAVALAIRERGGSDEWSDDDLDGNDWTAGELRTFAKVRMFENIDAVNDDRNDAGTGSGKSTKPGSEKHSAKGEKKRAGKGTGKLDRIFSKADNDELLNFLNELLKTNTALRNRFYARFAEILDDDPETRYRNIIRSSIKAATNRYGFIDDASGHELNEQLDTLHQKALELAGANNLTSAFLILRVITEEACRGMETAEDHDSILQLSAEQALFELGNQGRTAPDALRSTLFNWCMTQLRITRNSYHGLDRSLTGILPELITGPAEEKIFLGYIDELLKKAESTGRYGYYSGVPDLSTLVRTKLAYLENTGRHDLALQLLEKHIDQPEFRLQLIEKAIDSRQYDRARALCFDIKRKGHSAGGFFAGNSMIYREHLLRIAKLTKNSDEMRKWYLELFLTDWNHKWYKEYRQSWPSTEWEPECEKLITLVREKAWRGDDDRTIADPVGKLAHIYIQEGYHRRLLQLAEQHTGDINLLLHWHKHLVPHYPDEVLDLFEEGISHMSEATGRANYRSIASVLKTMKSLPGGDERAYALMTELLAIYNNRPAMKEEFKKAFKKWF